MVSVFRQKLRNCNDALMAHFSASWSATGFCGKNKRGTVSVRLFYNVTNNAKARVTI